MLIKEVAASNSNLARLAAISQFLIGRADDTSSQKVIAYPTFKKLAAGEDISLTKASLKELIQKPPLSNFIQDVTGDSSDENSGQVMFAGSVESPDTMTVDQARATVDSMAKRAAKRDL